MQSADQLPIPSHAAELIEASSQRVLVLDGAMGTMIQAAGLDESDFRGSRFAGSTPALKGLNDILVITRPEVILGIHRQYIEAGADIITTDSFNANAISLADYGLAEMAEEINTEAARLARRAADEAPERRWVAGSMGPTNRSLSIPDDSGTTFDDLARAYETQARGLILGGVDLLLIETIFDGLNAKAAVYGSRRAMVATGIRLPLMLSVTLTEAGRTLSGQTLDALAASVSHASPWAISLNCGFGADGLVPHLSSMQPIAAAIGVYPNAGLPNAMGQYDETPATMAAKLKPVLDRRMINIVGGCCGTTPDHIAAIAAIARKARPRTVPQHRSSLMLAGLETLEVTPERNFINIGERCNVAGSRKFLRLIKEGAMDQAEEIARSQVEAGAQMIDINMDDAMLDSRAEMVRFISRIATVPEIARVPTVIDSSDWNTVTAALKCVQGRPVVNSISLKEGEEAMLHKAREIHELGAAMVVMAFDEQGQADTFERRIEIASRAYNLLTSQGGIPPCDIIFDPNILTIATGIEEHADYATDFLRATEWIKSNLPGAKVSGGVSNLSFALRGNNYVREAMHAVFLYHAVARGMDMAIVNAAALMPVDEIPDELRTAIEDVILNRRHDATDRLIAIASEIKTGSATGSTAVADNTAASASQQLTRLLVKGSIDGMETLMDQAIAEAGSAMALIDGALMEGMNHVGELFGQGRMFLPQVVKSARAMKHAVDLLTPIIESEKSSANRSTSGKIVLATVKGDVHDIGKNIVGVVMNCNNFDITDLGVMVPGEEIVDRAMDENADFIGLSGLITPSLTEMCHVASVMEQRGLSIPLLIGGATASELHTAVKIAPLYSGPVVYTRDAAALPAVCRHLADDNTRQQFIEALRDRQRQLRDSYTAHNQQPPLTLAQARSRRLSYTVPPQQAPVQQGITDMTITIAQARKAINWRPFFTAWGLDASLASIAEIGGCDHCAAQWLASMPQDKRAKASEAMQLFKEASRALDRLELMTDPTPAITARIALLPAASQGDDIIIALPEGSDTLTIPTMRQQAATADSTELRLALADFVYPAGDDGTMHDHIGIFAVTTGEVIENLIADMKKSGNDAGAILYQSVADRLAEAATEIMHTHVRQRLWGYGEGGIRPAVGYPSLPDQSLVHELDKVIDYKHIGITVTPHGALKPAASTTGLLIARNDARYFVLGSISDEQKADYARRRGMSPDSLAAYLPA
ncbi:MAG: methionine synthase [Muribaculaceae bacterium]|nr:methionine synthase [Muribaculaceae bacterium]